MPVDADGRQGKGATGKSMCSPGSSSQQGTVGALHLAIRMKEYYFGEG